MIDNYKTILPKTQDEIDEMYRIAFYIGKFILFELESRYQNFRDWIKKSKEENSEIRIIIGETLYDVEIKNKKNGKWLKIGEITSKALKEEIEPKK